MLFLVQQKVMIIGQDSHDMDTPNNGRIAIEAGTGLERGDVKFSERHLCQCLVANMARPLFSTSKKSRRLMSIDPAEGHIMDVAQH